MTNSIVYTFSKFGLESASNRLDIPTGPLNFIGRLPFPLFDEVTNEYSVQIKYDNVTYSSIFNYIIDKECYEFEPLRVCWKNSLGGTDYFTFKQKNTWNSRVARETYRKNLKFDYKIGDRGETISNETIERFWSVTSDYLNDVEALFIQSMFESPEVYIMSRDVYVPENENPQDYPFNLIPVIVQTPQYDYKSNENGDELIEYTFELKESVTKYINI